MEKAKIKARVPEVYESSLLGSHLLGINKEELLRSARQEPEHFKVILMDLENSLRRYLSEGCDRNKQGEFLEKTEKLLVELYNNEIPPELNDVVKGMIELIIDHYSENKEYYAQRGKEEREQTLRKILEEAGIKGIIDK